MKLLTCNTHSLVEDKYEEKLKAFVNRVAQEKFDIIALQEVNQTHGGAIINIKEIPYFISKEECVASSVGPSSLDSKPLCYLSPPALHQ